MCSASPLPRQNQAIAARNWSQIRINLCAFRCAGNIPPSFVWIGKKPPVSRFMSTLRLIERQIRPTPIDAMAALVQTDFHALLVSGTDHSEIDHRKRSKRCVEIRVQTITQTRSMGKSPTPSKAIGQIISCHPGSGLMRAFPDLSAPSVGGCCSGHVYGP